VSDKTAGANKIRVLLLGDSTVLGSVPRVLAPNADHLEDILRKLLEGMRGLPPVEVINKGEDGDTIHRLLHGRQVEVINKGQDNDTIQRMLGGRYENDVKSLPGGPVDFVFIRFGINDREYLGDFGREFPQTYRQLIAQIRRDQPGALITMETIIPYRDEGSTAEVNAMIRVLAEEAGLPVLDTHARFAAEMKHGKNMLVYRQARLADIPTEFRPLLPAVSIWGEAVFIHDHSLDVHLRNVPGWFADRHPNLAGYHVIASALAEYLAPLIRKRA